VVKTSDLFCNLAERTYVNRTGTEGGLRASDNRQEATA
jgi:hypothetical protein